MQIFLFGRSHVANRLEQASMVEPLNPFQGRQLHRHEIAPRTPSADDFGSVQPDDRLGERVAVAVADAPDRGFDTGFGEPLRIADREIHNRAD